MTRLDPRAPLVVDTRDLPRRAGSLQERRWQAPAPEPFGTDIVAVAAGSPLDIDVRAEAVTEGVLVTGQVSATASGSCVRCLGPVSLAVQAPFQTLFVYADRAAHHHDVGADDDDVLELSGDLLDLHPVLRDAVVTALPFQPVCRADCPGLCPECGALLAENPGHRHETVDPRWAVLRTLVATGPSDTDDERRT